MKCCNSDCDESGEYDISLVHLYVGEEDFSGHYCENHLLDKLCFTFKDLYRASDQTK